MRETKFKDATVEWSIQEEMEFVGGDERWYDYVSFDLVYCEPEGRGKGYAKKALQLAIDAARNEYPGLPIRLSVEPKEPKVGHDGLVRLYESVGFKVIVSDAVLIMEC